MKRPPFIKTGFWIESFLATLLVFFLIWLFFYLIHFSFKPFNYVAKALKEVQLTDLYFSKLKGDVADTNIVLVNIEDLDREGIAALISRIRQANPRVIGLDVFFSEKPDPGDSILSEALSRAGNLLVMARFIDPATQNFLPNYRSFEGIAFGHSNLPNNADGTEVVRSFHPFMKSGGLDVPAFAVKIAQKGTPAGFTKLLDRGNHLEVINYLGDIHTFGQMTATEVLANVPGNAELLKDKIVLVGYTGGMCRTSQDLEDLFYTPVNPHFYGRAHPDMFGLVIHANIVSMILRQSYVEVIPGWMLLMLSFVVVYLHVWAFALLFVKQHVWYHTSAKLIQLISFSLLLLVIFYIFKWTSVLIHTKFMLLGVILSVDILYLYETMALAAHRYFGFHSVFVPKNGSH